MSCPRHPQWPHLSEDCPLCASERVASIPSLDQFNPDLNKYETRNRAIEDLMNILARRIQEQLPPGWRFGLFLFQQEENADTNIFYCASAQTHELLPLIEEWARRQVQ